ncbi:unnamed protein product [Brugia pahangi]|uniref:Uncharacterized protein n=1 Tax=Brugia pahangi TaxID=6280 RepID=A0A0N4TNR6_BRUPA|nr:unnamed protein product [Brugia pahangi]
MLRSGQFLEFRKFILKQITSENNTKCKIKHYVSKFISCLYKFEWDVKEEHFANILIMGKRMEDWRQTLPMGELCYR